MTLRSSDLDIGGGIVGAQPMKTRKKGNLELIPVERTFLELVWDGLSQKEAASAVGLSLMQANSVLRVLKRRWQVPSTIALLRRALKLGVLAP